LAIKELKLNEYKIDEKQNKQKLNQQRKKKPHEMYYKTTNTFVVFG